MERSRKGKIRLAILYIIVGCILIGITAFAINKIKKAINSGANQGEEVVSNTPIPSPTSYLIPTNTPVAVVSPTPIAVNTLTPTVGPYKEPFIEADKIQYQILRYALYTSEGVSVDTASDGKVYKVGFSDLKKVLIDEGEADKCRPIPLSEVSCGDIAYTGNALGVCVGFDGGHPIFAYCSPNGSVNMVNQQEGDIMGMFLGYVLCDCDELYCGCYPLPAADFYDCAYGEWNNDFFIKDVVEKYDLKRYCDLRFDALNDMARAMNTDNVELFLARMFTEELLTSLTWENGYPVKFFHTFLEWVKAEPYSRWTLYPTAIGTHEHDTWGMCYDYSCEIVSLDPDTFCKSSGLWNFTVIVPEDGPISIMPHGYTDRLFYLQRMFGLRYYVNLDDDDAIGDGNETPQKQSEIGTITKDENGTQSIAIDETTTIYLGDDTNKYVVANDMDSVYEMYEKSGYIVNRELGAFYEGTFLAKDKVVTRLEKGVWKSLKDGTVVGFVDDRLTEFWYQEELNGDYMFCHWGYAKPEYINEDNYPTGFLNNAAFYLDVKNGYKYEAMWDRDLKETLYALQAEVTYEIVEIFGEKYLRSDNLEKFAPGRTVSFNGIDGLCYKLIPEGEQKSMIYCSEVYNNEWDADGNGVLEYVNFCVIDCYSLNEYAERPQERPIWKTFD